MRGVLATVCVLMAAAAHAGRILLVPIDSRPATGQFAKMIARMANVPLQMPPYEMLGRFTKAGDSDLILDWLRNQNYGNVDAVVVSADMIAYGGLIASRTNATPEDVALRRLSELAQIRRDHPSTKFYISSAIMRLTPTATRDQASFRLLIGKYAELKEKAMRTKNANDWQTLRNLTVKIPPLELQKYEKIRARDHQVQKELVRMVGNKDFDYLMLGQDDAKAFGLHVPETQDLKRLVQQYQIQGQVYFCEGIDQHANVLVSRALLRRSDWAPRVRVVYSDELGKRMYANYESKTIEKSLEDQLVASGARPVSAGDPDTFDYTLYLNTPKRREGQFQEFESALESDIDQGFPVAVADIDFANDGTADPELFAALEDKDRAVKLLSYAGWNTAGNTMGTTIPAANVYLLSRRIGSDPLKRELAQREFLLHRLVNDYAYHKFTRPVAYHMIDTTPGATREESYGPFFDEMQEFVRRDLGAQLQKVFEAQFLNQKFYAGNVQYEITGIKDVQIFLPWPRAYEVRLDFSLVAREVQ